MEKSFNKIQLALFFSENLFTSEKDRISGASKLQELLAEAFDSDSQLFPVPPEAPPQLPRFALASNDTRLTAQFTQARADIYFLSGEEGNPINLSVVPRLKEIGEKIIEYVNGEDTTIDRAGFISYIDFRLEDSVTCVNLVKNHFGTDAFVDPSELSFKYNHRTTENIAGESLLLNHLTEVKSEDSSSAIRLQLDINTHQDLRGEIAITKELLESFLDYSNQRTLNVHEDFPNTLA